MAAGLVGSVVDAKYRVDGVLGRGGMGAVFRAVHLGTDRTVALKVIVPDHAQRADFLARFEREARACGRLRHPNIVDVTDFGYADVNGRRLAYLVMEYLDGCSLADVLRDEKALPITWAVDLLQQVGSALEEAHRAGILHRDLKPDNIWLEPNRRGGYTIKVLDFGLAKLGGVTAEPEPPALPAAAGESKPPLSAPPPADVAEEATQVRPASSPSPLPAPADDSATAIGSVIGTPAYMSPEQCRGLPLTPRSDVYSLAVIAYRLLGGALPFSGPTAELIAAHVGKTPRPIRELRRDLPKEAAQIVMTGLSKSPEDRPASAGAFTEMLAARAFLSVSIIGLFPVVLLALFAAVNAIAFVYGVVIVPRRGAASTVVAAIMMTMGPGMLMLQGAVVPAVMQAVVAPLQPIDVRTLQRRFRPRLRTYLRAVAPMLVMFVVTGLWQTQVRPLMQALRPLVRDKNVLVATLGGLGVSLLPVSPLLAMFALLIVRSRYKSIQFLGAVAVVEGLAVEQALARSAQLAKGAGSQRAARVLVIAMAMTMGILGGVGVGLLSNRMPPEVALGTLAIFFALAYVFMGPFFSVINALAYLRARRALGEPLDKALADFERAVLPASHWQLAERERVATLIASRW